MQNQAQRDKYVQEMFKLVDSLNLPDKEHNRLLNAVGFEHMIMTMCAIQEKHSLAGVISPFVRASVLRETNNTEDTGRKNDT